jgi:tetratricopeptide (TPR) repeat protein
MLKTRSIRSWRLRRQVARAERMRRGYPEKAMALLADVAARVPDHPDGLAYISMLAVDLRRWPEARTWASAAASQGVSAEFTPHLDFALGSIAWNEGRLDEARERLQRAFDAEPKFDHGWYLAALHGTEGRKDEALKVIERGLAFDPANANLLSLRRQITAEGQP